MNKPKPSDALDLLPEKIGLQRTDDLLHAMLQSPPDPRAAPKPKKRPKKRAKK